MAEPSECLGHAERYVRMKKIEKIRASPAFESLDEDKKVLIKKGPVSVETSLKKLEENYASTSSWKMIEDGGVLSVPVEDFRMIDLQKPEDFGKVKKETKIESYTVGQTIENLNSLILSKYNEEKERFMSAGKSETLSEQLANAATCRFPLFSAVKAWQDVEAEIKLKKAVETLMTDQKIPSVIVRSLSQPQSNFCTERSGSKTVRRRRD